MSKRTRKQPQVSLDALATTFEEVVLAEFQFLIDEYGCSLERLKLPFGHAVGFHYVYHNSTTGVVLSWNWADGVRAYLSKVLDGAVPLSPHSPDPRIRASVIGLGWIARLKEPSMLDGVDPDTLTAEAIVQTVRWCANVLRTYGSEILRGDFSLFEEVMRDVGGW